MTTALIQNKINVTNTFKSTALKINATADCCNRITWYVKDIYIKQQKKHS